MNRQILRYFLTIMVLGWMVLIFLFSAQPAEISSDLSGTLSYEIVDTWDRLTGVEETEQSILERAAKIDHPVRKTAHMTEYAVLAMLVTGMFWAYGVRLRKNSLYTILVCFLYAGTDEFHQLFIQGRAGRFSDVLIDTAGAVIGILIIQLLLHRCRESVL